VREIDLLAYKVSIVKDFSLYTALIISCKKNESNAWALLSRPVEEQDPNYNWRPFKGWSNHPALQYYMKGKNWPHNYHEKLSKECPELFQPPPVDVFAFQEMNKASGSVQNDKAIFSSITSLMKAQSYEMSTLEGRQKNKKRLYQFNLVSLIDSDLVRVFFEGDKIESSFVDSEDYLCRYILNSEEAIARIKFVTAKSFPEVIKDYSKLHSKNKEVFSEYYDKFYSDAYKVWQKANLLMGDFRNAIRSDLTAARHRYDRKFIAFSDVGTYWHTEEKRLVIELHHESITLPMIDSLNRDEALKGVVTKALVDIFHYDGEYTFEEGIPF